jgi:O-antigen ligase
VLIAILAVIFPFSILTVLVIGSTILISLFMKRIGILSLLIFSPILVKLIYHLNGAPMPIFFYSLFFIVILAIVLQNVVFNNSINIEINISLFIFLVLFFIYTVFSAVVISSNKAYGSEKIVYLFLSIIYTLSIIILVQSKKMLVNLFVIISVFGVLLTVFGIFESILNLPTLTSKYNNRFSIVGINPIWIGRYLSYAIFSNIYLISKYNKEDKNRLIIPLVLISLIQFYFMLLTGSRGPLFAFLVSVFLIYSIEKRLKLSSIISLVLIVLSLFFLFSLILPSSMSDRLANKNFSGQSTTFIRILIYWEGLLNFWSSKLVGIGLGSFQFNSILIGKIIYPHNVFIELLAETGIIGFSLFMVILLKIIAMLKEVYKSSSKEISYILIVFLTTSLINASLSGNLGGNDYMWISFGIIWAARKVEYKNNA